MSLASVYQPQQVEHKWYQWWIERKLFHADPASSKPAYSVLMPPPNVTGMLTMGHVLNNTIQDIYVRWHRMKGYEVCWFPGIDHAGIATQSKVEQQLAKEGLTRYDLGREKFLARVKLQSAISDEEVIYREVKDTLYVLKYQLEDGSGYIPVATVRPETIFADVAVAVDRPMPNSLLLFP